MFLRILLLGLFFMLIMLWGDYIKVLIYLEIISLLFIFMLLYYVAIDYFSLNYFLRCLIFLVCESRIGFLLFILYIRIESDVVKKINLTQF